MAALLLLLLFLLLTVVAVGVGLLLLLLLGLLAVLPALDLHMDLAVLTIALEGRVQVVNVLIQQTYEHMMEQEQLSIGWDA